MKQAFKFLGVVSLIGLIWINALAQTFPGTVGLSAATIVSLFTNNINLKVMGLPTGGDDTAAINTASSAASALNIPVYVPCATYNHAGVLNAYSPGMYGDGYCSNFSGTSALTSNPTTALQIQGSGLELDNFRLSATNSGGAPRSSQTYASALTIAPGQTVNNFKVHNIWLTGQFAGTGIEMNYGSSNGMIKDNHLLAGILANPIIIQAPASNLEIAGNQEPGTGGYGDTCIEIVDYENLAVSTNVGINVHDNNLNNCGSTGGGHGISVVGGHIITIRGNYINTTTGRGIYIATEPGNTTSATDTIDIIGNVLQNINSADYGILVLGDAAHTTSNVNVIGNHIFLNGTATIGIQAGACDSCGPSNIQTYNVNISNNEIHGDGTHGSYGISGRGVNDLTIQGNTLSALQNYAIYNCCGNSGTEKILGNHLANLSLASSGTYEAIQLQNPGFTHVEVNDNSYTAGANAVSHLLTCSASYDIWASGNIGSTTDISGCNVKVGEFTTLPITQTGNYTYTIADQNNYEVMNCSSACALTIPTNATANFPVGWKLCFSSSNTGTVSLAGASGVTLSTYSTANLAGQNASACAKQISTNNWLAVGNFQ